jgi:hypothetical protein
MRKLQERLLEFVGQNTDYKPNSIAGNGGSGLPIGVT